MRIRPFAFKLETRCLFEIQAYKRQSFVMIGKTLGAGFFTSLQAEIIRGKRAVYGQKLSS